MKNLLKIFFNGQTYTLDQIHLNYCGPVIERMFLSEDEDEDGFYLPDNYKEYFEDLLNLIETGILSDKLLKLDRDFLKDLIDYCSLPFYSRVMDYPDLILKEYFYNQWYRSRQYDLKFKDFLQNNTSLIKFEETHMRKYREVCNLRRNIYRSRKEDTFSKLLNKNYYREYEELLKQNIGSYSNRVLHKTKFKKYTWSNDAEKLSFLPIQYNYDPLQQYKGLDKPFEYFKSNFKLTLCCRTFILPYKKQENGKITVDLSHKVIEDIYNIIKINTDERNKKNFLTQLSDWLFDGNLIVAGGYIVSQVAVDVGFTIPDIDFFFVNSSDPNSTSVNVKKIEEILQIHSLIKKDLRRVEEFPPLFYRTKNVIGYHNVQFILRLYSSIEQVLMGFDIAASSLCFDGKDFYMTRLADICFENRLVVPFLDQYSTSTTYRLCKYSRDKNFSIYIPGIDKISPEILNSYTYYKQEGLPAIMQWFYKDKIPKAKSDYMSYKETDFKNPMTFEKLNKVNKFILSKDEAYYRRFLYVFTYNNGRRHIYMDNKDNIFFDLFQTNEEVDVITEEIQYLLDNNIVAKRENHVKFDFDYLDTMSIDMIGIKYTPLSNSKKMYEAFNHDKKFHQNLIIAKDIIKCRDYEKLLYENSDDSLFFSLSWKKEKPGEQFTGSFEPLCYNNPSQWYQPDIQPQDYKIDLTENKESENNMKHIIELLNKDLKYVGENISSLFQESTRLYPNIKLTSMRGGNRGNNITDKEMSFTVAKSKRRARSTSYEGNIIDFMEFVTVNKTSYIAFKLLKKIFSDEQYNKLNYEQKLMVNTYLITYLLPIKHLFERKRTSRKKVKVFYYDKNKLACVKMFFRF